MRTRGGSIETTRRRARARGQIAERTPRAFEPALNAYSRGIVRSPAQTLEARATAIVVGRETRREMRRDLARLEAEESFGGVGYARVDPDALAAKNRAVGTRPRRARVSTRTRARDAKAAEETNGGFRPTLSSTPRAVALRDRVASADRRPWRAHASWRRVDEARGARGRRARTQIPSRRRTIRTEANAIGWLARCTRRLRRATRVGTPIVATRHARQRDARRNSRRRTRRDWRAFARRAAFTPAERRAVRDGSYLERDALGPALRDAGVFAAAPPSTRGAIRDEALAVYRLCACLGEGEGDVRAVPAWLFARFAGAVSRAETDRVCAIAKRRTRRRSRSNGPGAGPISVASSTSGDGARVEDAVVARGVLRRARGVARRGRSRPSREQPPRTRDIANADRSRQKPTTDARRRRRVRRRRVRRRRVRRRRVWRRQRAENACGDDAFSDSAPGNPLNLAARRLGFERQRARVERTRVERTGVELAGVERAERSVATLAVVLAGVRVSPAAEPDATRAETRRGGSTRA